MGVGFRWQNPAAISLGRKVSLRILTLRSCTLYLSLGLYSGQSSSGTHGRLLRIFGRVPVFTLVGFGALIKLNKSISAFTQELFVHFHEYVRESACLISSGTDLNQNNSSGVKGTIGYAPPEYGLGSEMSSIGDVYSFGILFLEVMTGKKPTDDMFNDGLSLHKFANMALPDHVIDVIDDDAIVLQRTEANAKKVEECMAATIKIGVSCSVDSPPQRMKIEIVVNELQRILEVFQNIQGTLFSPFAEYDFT
ncbi:kinase-like domain-containing protein [Tanacetum coccineum]